MGVAVPAQRPLRPHGLRLEDAIVAQLQRLSASESLGAAASRRLRDGFDLLTRESLACSALPPYSGLSHINANGLPFQWCICIDGGLPSVRFLCETGSAGDAAWVRTELVRARLGPLCAAIGTRYPDWIDGALLSQVLPPRDAWPAHWQSAIWLALAAQGDAVRSKIYLNLDRGDSTSRWRRVGWVLKALGRGRSLATWCSLSAHVSHDSWLSGLAVDLQPDGSAGRVKAYFRSGAVALCWLDRWYETLGASSALRDVHHMLDLLGPARAGPTFPDKAFFVSLEFSASEEASLKTDMPVCRWHKRDLGVFLRVRRLLDDLSLNAKPYLRSLDALGVDVFDDAAVHQLIGLGYEPDGARHVNIYCAPPHRSPGSNVLCGAHAPSRAVSATSTPGPSDVTPGRAI